MLQHGGDGGVSLCCFRRHCDDKQLNSRSNENKSSVQQAVLGRPQISLKAKEHPTYPEGLPDFVANIFCCNFMKSAPDSFLDRFVAPYFEWISLLIERLVLLALVFLIL